MTTSQRLLRRVRGTAWWQELGVVALLYAGYDLIRGFIAGSTGRAERDGAGILHLEQVLHLDPEHWLNDNLSRLSALAVPACYFYATLHFIVTPAVLIWLFHRRPAAYRPARTVLVFVTGISLIGFWQFPTAPPRLLTGAGFHDTLAIFSGWGWWGSDPAVPAGAAAIANQYAAMPSLHLAWALWCGVTVYRQAGLRWLRLAAIGYPVLTAAVIIGTANHYLLDVLVAAALWAITDVAVGRLRPARQDRAAAITASSTSRPSD
ncbi:MAG TPA: phosphatase PAP2 family protein [Jatrophihabitans sp.]|nr:phosphatase PAP2 family protein [Jatrophihabitans sp.]